MRRPMLALQALRPEALAGAVPVMSAGESRRIVSAVHRAGKLPDYVAHVRRVALDAARAAGHVPELTLVGRQASALDGFVKFAFEAKDGLCFETVRIPLERAGRYSVCVSSQIGCGLGCAFCATGRLGLARNLETWEIVEQVRHVQRELAPAWKQSNGAAPSVHGVVFQGMGEPLANAERVLEAIGVLTDPSAFAIDARAITVCTAGLPEGIRLLARQAPRVRLAISIGSALSSTRRHLMPITAAHPLDDVLDGAVEHARVTGLAPLWAITLLSGVNDSTEHARALAGRVLDFRERTSLRPRISVIAYNATAVGNDDPFRPSSREREQAFCALLHEAGIPTQRRYSGGSDVAAACGQLVARRAPRAPGTTSPVET